VTATNAAGHHIAVLVLLTDDHRPATTDAPGCEIIAIAMMFNVTPLVMPISVRSNPNTRAIRTNAELNLG